MNVHVTGINFVKFALRPKVLSNLFFLFKWSFDSLGVVVSWGPFLESPENFSDPKSQS